MTSENEETPYVKVPIGLIGEVSSNALLLWCAIIVMPKGLTTITRINSHVPVPRYTIKKCLAELEATGLLTIETIEPPFIQLIHNTTI